MQGSAAPRTLLCSRQRRPAAPGSRCDTRATAPCPPRHPRTPSTAGARAGLQPRALPARAPPVGTEPEPLGSATTFLRENPRAAAERPSPSSASGTPARRRTPRARRPPPRTHPAPHGHPGTHPAGTPQPRGRCQPRPGRGLLPPLAHLRRRLGAAAPPHGSSRRCPRPSSSSARPLGSRPRVPPCQGRGHPAPRLPQPARCSPCSAPPSLPAPPAPAPPRPAPLPLRRRGHLGRSSAGRRETGGAPRRRPGLCPGPGAASLPPRPCRGRPLLPPRASGAVPAPLRFAAAKLEGKRSWLEASPP